MCSLRDFKWCKTLDLAIAAIPRKMSLENIDSRHCDYFKVALSCSFYYNVGEVRYSLTARSAIEVNTKMKDFHNLQPCRCFCRSLSSLSMKK